MANHTAFECGECCRGVILYSGFNEVTFDESDEESFLDEIDALQIKISDTNMCSDCDLRLN